MTALPIQHNVFMNGADESQEHTIWPVLRNEQADAGNILERSAQKIKLKMSKQEEEMINGIWDKFGQRDQKKKRNAGRKDEKEKNMELNLCSPGICVCVELEPGLVSR